jgi:putative hydrolase of the HAD superfamily
MLYKNINMNQLKPQVIFLDAVGTIFGVKGSVGEIYGEIARDFGVSTDSKQLNKAFYQSFKDAPPLAFADVNSNEIKQLEFQWWKAIASGTFAIVGVKEQFTDFDAFFQKLYEHFATAHPWEVYPDTITSLNRWQKQGIQLGIISNFDTRIYQVLQVLELRSYFFSITISSSTGVAKPNPQIFYTALEKHNCNPESAWYIGDSLKEDYYGAKSLGIKSFLIQRYSGIQN